MALREIDSMRVDGKFVDSDGNRVSWLVFMDRVGANLSRPKDNMCCYIF
jgi:hypothetical protein